MRIGIKHAFIVLMVFSLGFTSCNSSKKNESTSENKNKPVNNVVSKQVSVIKVVSPKNGKLYTVGDQVNINIELKDVDVVVDSLVAETSASRAKLNSNNLVYTWDTKSLNVGQNKIRLYAYSEGHRIDTYSLKLRFKSDISPELLECKIVKTYSHDKKDYTQGLIFEDGIMYEGTGQKGASVLKKINFETGKLMAELSLPAQYFGEGITIFGDKIIQLTWQSRTGFVYDKKSFKLLSTLGYDTQGWGLTSDGKKLIMSDGSHTIHFLDPVYFNKIGDVEVYDNNGIIRSLNELEYIDGLVYANIYQEDIIVAFDPETGKVVKRIDCRKIVPKEYIGNRNNVLNGIAYDKKGDRLFVTGKHWPSLFEVKFVK
ncbi:MAG: glutaminyl-peptide cyclotransferase [Bacteroidales bacterium]|nr:glutaminyl-peptide cyclotransferase [Bacteroidales bacterium]